MHELEQFFQTDNKTFWRGSPNTERGELFQLQFEQRKKAEHPYVYLHLGEVGRRGAPWGTLFLEVSGNVYHYRADKHILSRRAHDGSLTEKGKYQVARGTSAVIDSDIAWKWIQESIQVSKLLTELNMIQLKAELEFLQRNSAALTHYQAYQYALERGVVVDPTMHNCSSFVALCLGIEVPIEIARMPVLLFDHIKSLVHRGT